MAEKTTINESEKMYENPGEFDEEDEVTLMFPNEDNKTVFFSKFVLTRSSRVFKAMFQHDLKEKKDKNVNIEDIKVDDFIAFLKWSDPMVSKPPTAENVLKVVEIAEKYQNESMINQCRNIMGLDIREAKPERIIAILLVAAQYNYTEVVEEGVERMKANYRIREFFDDAQFEKLPGEIKYRILSKRVSQEYSHMNAGFTNNLNI
ncbi:hypothetical protein MAR_011975 [Mya arenaria]|uniref:BTB domain-containing protein n=1 Tax=Mya arenaria TaxID=6604 RepID=A0ABY7FZU2_MYAAR|nr:uncharacterized protein LOC128218420 [Mya arenaria]WAR26271.1 hypothetical protein MAR_011975 [Mya arenaria]